MRSSKTFGYTTWYQYLIHQQEPTSGLDAAIAYNLMTTMKAYSETSNKTVVTTIHQPSSAIFHMFNRLLLIVDGHVRLHL